ncbi:MAG TPA: MOSC domain-containing protein [Dehalococcoidia bacterium]|nr:MOSC domain-containing protein [Dehalococcoidia bacterium]
MAQAHVAAIFIYPEESKPGRSVDAAVAIEGRGLQGDRYFAADDPHEDPGHDLTLIEAEAIEGVAAGGIPFELGDSRRNVVTRGIDLNALVDTTFRVGNVECRGVRLNHPCAHLESLTQPGVLRALVDHGGLRAAIVKGGEIRVGDTIAVATPEPSGASTR